MCANFIANTGAVESSFFLFFASKRHNLWLETLAYKSDVSVERNVTNYHGIYGHCHELNQSTVGWLGFRPMVVIICCTAAIPFASINNFHTLLWVRQQGIASCFFPGRQVAG
jgi:hypothetical protein